MRLSIPLLLRLLVAALAFATLRAQDVRITEFLVSNVTDIVDEDLTHQPWIEIWNPSTTTSIALGGLKLSNGTTTWTFPSVSITPDERMVIWASGKNRTVTTAPLHTNFTLPTTGSVQLLNASNIVLSQISSYPAQSADVSYGREEVDAAITATQVGFYTKTTPGDRNSYSGTGVAGNVQFDKPSQAFTPSIVVALSQVVPDAAAVIRYTTDGTVPTTTSTLYTAALTISSTQMIRARVFKTGLLPGEAETNCYLLLDATTSGFSSPMPILAVTNFGAGTPPDTGDQRSFVWLWELAAPDNRARFTNLPTLTMRTVIDRRGSSTLGNAKHNVNLESRKARDDDDRKVSILGMADGSDYVLSGPFNFDRSDLHNPLMYAMSRSLGRYAPDTRQVEVFFDVNGGSLNAPSSNTNDYFGIYNLSEKIRRDQNRVNVHKLGVYDNDAVGKTGGHLWKVDRRDTGDSGFTAGGQTMAYYYPKEIELLAAQRAPQKQHLTDYINSMNTALQSAAWNNPVTGYAPYLDIPAAIDHHLLNVWGFNVDGLRLSGYWFKERGGKMAAGPIWDFDRALSSTDGRDSNPATWRSQSGDLGTDFFNFIWWNRLFLDIDFYQKYIDRWLELRRGKLSQTTVETLIDTLATTVPNEAVTRDVTRWVSYPKRSWTRPFTPFNTIAASEAAEVQRLKDYLQQRANFFDSQWVGPVAASVTEGNVSAGTQVTLTGPAGGTIYYTLNGADPRPSGGGAPSGVLTYSGTPITINATTRIRTRAYNASWSALTGANNPPLVSKWSGLTNGRYSTDTPAAAGNLVVTEVNYHPTDPTAAELAINPVFDTSDFEFLELRNNATTPIDLGGAQFTLGITFAFSGDAALTLAPGGYVILAANPAAFAARYGASATVVGPWAGDLDNGGEQLTLKAANNATILDFTYDDLWYPPTDGLGRTLVIYDPYAAAGAFSTAVNWRASAALGGSPGASEPNLTPLVNAGADTAGVVTGTALTGTATDDSQPNPPRNMTFAWSQFSGPGTTNFTPANTLATSAAFSLPGIYTLRLAVGDSALTGTDDVLVYAKDTPAAWLARHPGIGTLDDDFEKDGRTNFAEFALGLDPSVPDTAAAPITTLEAGHLTLTYTRIKPPSTVLYAIEVADADVLFRAPNIGEVTEQILSDNGVTQTVKVTDTVSTPAQPNRFLRLRVSPAP